jgi:hypothetical protein
VNQILFLRSDDWVAMYIDGKMVAEGHSISQREVIQAISDHCDVTLTLVPEGRQLSEAWLAANGWEFPEDLSVLKKEDYQ